MSMIDATGQIVDTPYPYENQPIFSSVYELLGQVSRQISHIAKDREARMGDGGGRYAFRGIDDVYDAIHEPLAQAGILTPTKVIKLDYSERPRPNKSPQTITRLTLQVDFVGPRGDYLSTEAAAEAQDYGDKATAKAISVAYRTAVIQMFQIPISDSSQVDIEEDNDERVASFVSAKPKEPVEDLQHLIVDMSSNQKIEFAQFVKTHFLVKDLTRPGWLNSLLSQVPKSQVALLETKAEEIICREGQ